MDPDIVQMANPYQIAAWQATVVGAFLGSIQLLLGVWKQRREARAERAKFGYALLDRLFDDEWSSELLYALDCSNQSDARKLRNESSLATDFSALFLHKTNLSSERADAVYERLDAMLYFCDRIEHSIEAKLTSFGDVRMPTAYYVAILCKFKAALVPYIKGVGYDRVLKFFERFDEWKNPGTGMQQGPIPD